MGLRDKVILTKTKQGYAIFLERNKGIWDAKINFRDIS